MSQKSQDTICDALNHMVDGANEMYEASKKLKIAGDHARAEKLDKIRDNFRDLRMEITKLVGEEIAKTPIR